MAKYEAIVVFKPDMQETQVKDEERKIESLLRQEGASSVAVEQWGKKDLSYIVRKYKNGYFTCFKFESAKSDTVKNLSSVLRISETAIRFQTHRINERLRKFKGNPRRTGEQGDDFIEGGEESY
jgi:small subunit ribosomal protein S6